MSSAGRGLPAEDPGTKGHSAETSRLRGGAGGVGVQPNRLCTLTGRWRSYCFMNVDLMEQW